MADNTEDFGTNGEKRDDSFDEMLDRAEADLDAAEAEEGRWLRRRRERG